MGRWRLDISYDGSRFRGWARQEGLRTVQGEIEAALERLFSAHVPIIVAGRTDSGVHAIGQVASLELPAGAEPPETFARALNALTPEDVAITAVAPAADDFDARRSALTRRYRYRVLTGEAPDPFERGRALHHRAQLDRPQLDAAATMIAGQHDFTAFTPTETEHVFFDRTVVDAGWATSVANPRVLEFEVEADAFLRSMVRVLVGTMLEIGSGRRSLESLSDLLEGRPRSEAGETIAAHGLYLLRVSYPDEHARAG